MKIINPYLTFSDKCEEAFNFYKSVFGGEFTDVNRFKDIPSEAGPPIPENEGNKIMHISLPLGKETILMGSDSPDSMGPVTQGNNFSISVSADSEKEADKLFNGLSNGGKITMPIQKTFWNAYFGMLTDKYGVNWMVSYDYGQQ
jgi:PhnB protein